MNAETYYFSFLPKPRYTTVHPLPGEPCFSCLRKVELYGRAVYCVSAHREVGP